MRIKKLDMIGFKSFKDRTVIHFDHGITGIVGPNGCGKSNIVDALIWVMGEMSAKHLRGSSMSDVIFSGTEKHAPLGLAEVSLILENDGGPFPSQYSRYSEIMVTRRLHRSGETNYLINKEPARLRDIQEIFMDTGAGSRGFSIIEQGRISEVITSKPEQRRFLIEEVAGITKFKVRKRESQRKLISTEQNLLRLQDIIDEQKRRLNSLERQAQKAEKYKTLKKQIQDKDLWLISQKYLKICTQEAEAEKSLTQFREQEACFQADIEKKKVEGEALKLQLSEKQTLLNDLQIAYQEKKDHVRDEEDQVRQLKFEREQAHRDKERVRSLLEQYGSQEESLSFEKSQLDAKVREASKQWEDCQQRFEQQSANYQQCSERVDQWDKDLTEKRREVLAVSASHFHLEAKKSSLEAQMEQAQEQWKLACGVREDLRTQKKTYGDRHQEMSDQLEEQRQVQLSLMRDVENFEKNLQSLSQQKELREKEVQQFKDQVGEITHRWSVLKNLQENFEDFQQGVRTVLLWQKEELGEEKSFLPVSEIIEVPEEYELAMEAVLGNRLQILLSESLEESLKALSYLREQGAGCSSFLSTKGETLSKSALDNKGLASESGVNKFLKEVVSVADPYSLLVHHFISNVVVVDSLSLAFDLHTRYLGYMFVTMDGDTLSEDGVLTGGKRGDSGLLQRRREVRQLASQREKVSDQLSVSQESVGKLEAQYAKLQEEKNGIQKSHDEQKMWILELIKDCERMEVEMDHVEEALKRQNQVIKECEAQLQGCGDQHKEMVDRMKETCEKKKKLEEEIESLTDNLSHCRLERESIQGEVTDLQVELASKEQEIEGWRGQGQILENSLKQLKEQLAEASEESNKNLEFLSDYQEQIERSQVELEALLNEVRESEGVLSFNQTEYDELMTRTQQVDEQVSKGMSALNKCRTQTHEAQLKWEQLRMKSQYLVDQVEEKYMLDLREREKVLEEVEENVQKVESELEDCRIQLKRMGEVNLAAIGEHDELMERHQFLSRQYQDLVDSKDQLTKVIERINRICSKRFKETFEQVNERFKRVFPVLFGGGQAELILCQEPELSEDSGESEKNGKYKGPNKEEEGVDIMARPPGKKLQNLNLLSGGEKALTAVSLIFSIFLVKPSPFCLLDEVDAPLDDVNVSHFNDLVVEMSRRSQVIVVTHNKYTMRVNNRLFGVTMEEKGVSKMVSVNLAGVDRMIQSEKVIQDV